MDRAKISHISCVRVASLHVGLEKPLPIHTVGLNDKSNDLSLIFSKGVEQSARSASCRAYPRAGVNFTSVHHTVGKKTTLCLAEIDTYRVILLDP